MRLKPFLAITISLSFMTGCSQSSKTSESSSSTQKPNSLADLGSIEKCQHYTGLPQGWLKQPTAGMVLIADGHFNFGSEKAYPDELNFGKKQREVKGFWIDQTEVTVAQFASFVEATEYITDAEKQKQAAVFSPDPHHPQQWWQLKSGYTWNPPQWQ